MAPALDGKEEKNGATSTNNMSSTQRQAVNLVLEDIVVSDSGHAEEPKKDKDDGAANTSTSTNASATVITRDQTVKNAMKDAIFLTESKMAANAVPCTLLTGKAKYRSMQEHASQYAYDQDNRSEQRPTMNVTMVRAPEPPAVATTDSDELLQVGPGHSRPGAFLANSGTMEQTQAFAKSNLRPANPEQMVPATSQDLPPREQQAPDLEIGTLTNHSIDEDERMAVANQISEDDIQQDSSLEEAEAVDPTKLLERQEAHKQRQNLRKILAGIALLALSVIAISVGVALNNKSSNNGTTSNDLQAIQDTWNPDPVLAHSNTPSSMPITPPPDTIMELRLEFKELNLPSATMEALESPLSPQSKAIDWLANHPQLPTFPQWKKIQLFVLVTFFYALDGENWPEKIYNDWLDPTKDECYWFSDLYIIDHHDVWKHPERYNPTGASSEFDVCIPDPKDPERNISRGHYFHLGLTGVYGMSLVTGKVPPEVALLPYLEVFHVTSNRNMTGVLKDMIPTQLSTDVNLTSLQLWGNDWISGSIPDHVWNMHQLQVFNIGGNSVNGSVSTELGRLTDLTKFEIGYNQMTGKLPSEVGLLTQLTTFITSDNLFSGTIPRQVWDLSTLEELGVDAFEESYFPSEIGLLPSLELLHIYHSPQAGPIPSELFQLTNLTALMFKNCSLVGTLSPDIGLLSNLLDFLLPENPLLTGTLPSQLGLMSNVGWIELQGTSLHGPVPSEFGQMSGLEGMLLYDTALTGEIPMEVCDMPYLQEILLDCTMMSCNCPEKCNEEGGECASPCICVME